MDGVLIIDKPYGMTSHDVVSDVKRSLRVKKVGHSGTLDPMATGVLAVCVNEATKLTRFFLDDEKEYRATMLLGIRTDTLDMEGTVTSRCEPTISDDDIIKALKAFVGTIEQRVPRYSAVKIKGKPLYKWTRQGDADIEPPVKIITVHNIDLVSIDMPYVTFDVSCSKGTYIRSLCSDIGENLGCGACLSGLRRTRSGNFSLQDAISIEGLSGVQKLDVLENNMIPIEDALPGFDTIVVDEETAKRIRMGWQPDSGTLRLKKIALPRGGDLVKFATEDNKIIAVANSLYSPGDFEMMDDRQQAFKILRVIN